MFQSRFGAHLLQPLKENYQEGQSVRYRGIDAKVRAPYGQNYVTIELLDGAGHVLTVPVEEVFSATQAAPEPVTEAADSYYVTYQRSGGSKKWLDSNGNWQDNQNKASMFSKDDAEDWIDDVGGTLEKAKTLKESADPRNKLAKCSEGGRVCRDVLCPYMVEPFGDNWVITMGHAGYNSPANNRAGYKTEKEAKSAVLRYLGYGKSHLEEASDSYYVTYQRSGAKKKWLDSDGNWQEDQSKASRFSKEDADDWIDDVGGTVEKAK